MRPIGLSDRQLAVVTRAAESLPQHRRDDFLRALASRLGSEPSDQALQTAIVAALIRAKPVEADVSSRRSNEMFETHKRLPPMPRPVSFSGAFIAAEVGPGLTGVLRPGRALAIYKTDDDEADEGVATLPVRLR